jgi:hypothetical protein
VHILDSSTADLPSALRRHAGNTAVFYGGWRQLTVKVQHALAMWSLQRPQRMCGLIPADVPLFQDFGGPPEPLPARGVLLADPTGNALVRDGKARKCSRADVLAMLADPSALTAIVISGHGAECYIQLGSGWLSTDPDPRLPGPIVPHGILRAPLVFLNACSCLRMGDSVVPRAYSLADQLYRRGTTVVGAFRNIRMSADTAKLFAEGLSSGAAVGAIVRRLNIEALKRGAVIPPFQVLGAPQTRMVATTRSFIYGRARPNNSAVSPIAEQVGWLEQLHHTICSWFEPSAGLEQSYLALRQATRSIYELCQEEIASRLTQKEIVFLVERALGAVVEHRQNILLELQRRIQTGRWLESLYGSISMPRRSRRTPRSDAALTMTHSYEPYSRATHPVMRLDCCVRGTLAEWIGQRPKMRPKVYVEADHIVVDAPPLNKSQHGRIFVHRTAAVEGRTWPHRGGRISIPVEEIPFRGRVTVVSAVIGERSLSLHYSTVFVPVPSDGFAAIEGQSSKSELSP